MQVSGCSEHIFQLIFGLVFDSFHWHSSTSCRQFHSNMSISLARNYFVPYLLLSHAQAFNLALLAEKLWWPREPNQEDLSQAAKFKMPATPFEWFEINQNWTQLITPDNIRLMYCNETSIKSIKAYGHHSNDDTLKQPKCGIVKTLCYEQKFVPINQSIL